MLENRLRVSVVIPLFNSATTIKRAVASVLDQTENGVEIIVVDDASRDEGWKIVSAMAGDDARIRPERLARNAGKPTAMNHGISLAEGRWIAVLDADDWFHPDRLKTLVDLAEQNRVDFVADNQFLYDSHADRMVGTAFADNPDVRLLDLRDFARNINPLSAFDFGRLKPIINSEFIREKRLTYNTEAQFSEDFYYHFDYFAAGGTALLVSRPFYYWTQPYGTISRRWTETGLGPWRYNYAGASTVNDSYVAAMRQKGDIEVMRLLEARARRFRIMHHFVALQKALAHGRYGDALLIALAHVSIWPMLASRIGAKLIGKIS